MHLIELNRIDDNPFQKRAVYDEIRELAQSIYDQRHTRPQTKGLQQVPVGRVVFSTSAETRILTNEEIAKYASTINDDAAFTVQLEFGHRRARAFSWIAQNWDDTYQRMPVILTHLSDDDMLNGVWTENAQRKDLAAVEEAELLAVKVEQAGSHKAAASAWGLARATVSNKLKLLAAPDDLKQANRTGQLSERQTAALARVHEVGQALNGAAVEWGSETSDSWGKPMKPTAYIKHVLENADQVTSDDIRNHTTRIVKHAGETIPDGIARHEFTWEQLTAPMIQAQCKGCAFRVNDHCLKRPCLTAKKAAWPDIVLAEFSAETGIPIADNPEDALSGSHADIRVIKALFEAGETENMVCAWASGDAFRPKHDNYWTTSNSMFYAGGWAGLAVGYVGELPADDDADPVAAYNIPDKATRQIVQENMSNKHAAVTERALAALVAAVETAVSDWSVLSELLFSPEFEPQKKPAAVLLEMLLRYGRGHKHTYDTLTELESLESLMQRAGVGALYTSEQERLELEAYLMLYKWYEWHDSHWNWKEYAKSGVVEIPAWLAAWRQAGGNDDDVLVAQMKTAVEHMQQKLIDEVRS